MQVIIPICTPGALTRDSAPATMLFCCPVCKGPSDQECALLASPLELKWGWDWEKELWYIMVCKDFYFYLL